ncbi:large ribosomal subunit protein uL23m [Lethenteron reissneri]|uniref:large ribosomal subunit protein uL23m n=1 Tax=Lethenteron reissneri TaxID=7753 RepID=UPI002AB7CA40|nr:large ribosomal subunit protein uL23m [Lethenteron reissneri]
MARRVLMPIYQYGNPQLRVFRTNFFMTMVRPGKELPEDTVQFRVSMEMTKFDIKNYLQKIYNVSVAEVRTRIQYGSNKKKNHLNQHLKKPDYKVAYVQLAQGQTFTFPNLFPEKETKEEDPESLEAFERMFRENEEQRKKGDPRRGNMNEWFNI